MFFFHQALGWKRRVGWSKKRKCREEWWVKALLYPSTLLSSWLLLFHLPFQSRPWKSRMSSGGWHSLPICCTGQLTQSLSVNGLILLQWLTSLPAYLQYYLQDPVHRSWNNATVLLLDMFPVFFFFCQSSFLLGVTFLLKSVFLDLEILRLFWMSWVQNSMWSIHYISKILPSASELM